MGREEEGMGERRRRRWRKWEEDGRKRKTIINRGKKIKSGNKGKKI